MQLGCSLIGGGKKPYVCMEEVKSRAKGWNNEVWCLDGTMRCGAK